MYDLMGTIGGPDQWHKIVIMVIVAYFIGNISPAILIGRAYGMDIKKEGSGNAGTTNVLRILGKKAAIATLLIDILKGSLAVALAGILLGQLCAMICMVAVLVGHVWPIVFKLKGGKGVATAFGGLMAINPLLGLACLGIVVLGVVVSRRMSVGSIAGSLMFPIVAFFLEPDFILIGSIATTLILLKHRANIGRLIRGEEPKMNFKK